MIHRVLVTGADGFIGSHVVERLLEDGHDVRAFCLYNSFGSFGWLDTSTRADDVEKVLGDVRDDDSISSAVAGCDVIVHAAALIAIPYSYQAPRSYVDTNVTGTLNVLRAATAAGAARVVHMSTSEVYGTPEQLPITEDHPLRAQSPYAASKIGADMMAEAWCRTFGTEVVTIRPFNTFGPRQSLRAVIPTIIGQLLGSGRVELGDLRPRRDFTFVTDTVDGLVRAVDADLTPPVTIQLGTGRAVSVAELVELCASVLGVEVDLTVAEERMRPEGSEVMALQSDPSRAARLLGWKPVISLEDGVAATAEFVRTRAEYLGTTRFVI